MKKVFLICLMALCLATSAGAATTIADSSAAESYDDFWPVVVLLHDGTDNAELKNILLIVINQSTGKAMKVTMNPGLYSFEEFDPMQPDSAADCLQIIGGRLQLPLALDKYVALSLDALDTLEPGEAKGKGPLELVQLGFSLLGSMETNLSMTQTVSTFRQAFAQKDDGIEISLPEEADARSISPDDVNWDAIRETLNRALNELQG